jgi:hypothetical protein
MVNIVKIVGGKMQDPFVVASQLQGLRDMLRYATGAMEASAVDIVPRAGEAAIESRLLEEARVEMELAEQASKELAARGLSTRASTREEAGGLSDLLALAKARSLAAVGAWESKADRYRSAVKAAESLCDKQTEEVKNLVLQVATACPAPVLELLLPGARSVGMRRSMDGSVVTPGEILAAVLRVLQGQIAVTIPVALSRYGKIFAPLSGIVSPKAVELWGTMLSQLKALQRDLGGQVGSLTAHIVGRWIHDIVREAVGTLGGSGPSLADLLEAVLGDGKVLLTSFSFDDLFLLLVDDEVRSKVEWLSNLPVDVMALKAHKAAVPGAAGGMGAGAPVFVVPTPGPRPGLCYRYRDTGACHRGDACRFSHSN